MHELLNDPRNFESIRIVEDLRGGFEVLDIAGKLRSLGAGKTAYLVSQDWDADGKTGPLEEVLALVTGEGEFVY